MSYSGFIGAYVAIFLVLFLSAAQRRRIFRKNRRQAKKGVKKTMPVEMIKEFIGKTVSIYVEGELGGFQGKILSMEGNWLKVEEKKHIRLVNGDMITQIRAIK
ncbi:MAG: hypothetical protein MJ174_05365 [Treponema sp.]|nr:hypothetical protein [Treponema sp.]